MIDPKDSNHIILTWEEWVDQFKPEINPLKTIDDDKYGEEQYRFETYGDELDALKQKAVIISVTTKWEKGTDFNHYWTLVDWGDGGMIMEGFHIVNRLLHFITKKPYDPNKYYSVDEYSDESPERSEEEEARIEEWIHND